MKLKHKAEKCLSCVTIFLMNINSLSLLSSKKKTLKISFQQTGKQKSLDY